MAVIRIEQLQLDSRLAGVSLNLKPGELFGVIGPNGSGKSSLLECIAGLQRYTGDIHLDEHNLAHMPGQARARRIALLPQRCQSAWALKVADVIALGRLPWGDEDADIIARAARQTGVFEWFDARVDHLSGGEQARVWLARVLAGRPEVILADEPLASLDLHYQQRVLELLRDYARAERSVLLSIHDLTLAAQWCDRLVLLDSGRVHAIGTPETVLTPDNIRHVYDVEVEVDFSASRPSVRVLR
ncbi:iron complex transport system ATP-binding protein [Marinobacterium halophilum]|uniref:Iron complex transport system ATP-binding protein n=1 Tax=Marinobacterium halophilum TaxID=267374 RepID=A0A2P8ERT7_9GAMM|nr:ABC transporter ATP-binding protein [Marinobacterium halophilum]PSL12207.1 iron complex transport system ATP-binding protein [Marinobacterium halophilum]